MLVVGTVNYELGSEGGGTPLDQAARELWQANATVTSMLSREGFTRQESVRVGVEDAPRPNGANYASRGREADEQGAQRNDSERAEQIRRILRDDTMTNASARIDALIGAAGRDSETYYGKVFGELVNAMNDLRTVADPTVATLPQYAALRDRARGALDQALAPTGDYARGQVATGAFDTKAQAVRNGSRVVSKAQLSDIRLMRATSSYLSNTSHFDYKDPRSRCGLKIGHLPNAAAAADGTRNPARDAQGITIAGKDVDPGNGTGNANDVPGAEYWTAETLAAAQTEVGQAELRKQPYARIGMRRAEGVTMMPMADVPVAPTYGVDGSLKRPADTGVGEYILGGWCIGTVLDSAASRAMMHAQQIRTSQSSMAINVNVNVEWWDADKLHSHYMDVDRGHFAVGEHPSIEIATKNGTPLTDAARAALPPTMRQVPQSTVMQRNQTSMRDVDTYTRELEKEVKQTLSAVIPGNTVLGYDLDAQTTEVGVDAAEKATLDQIRGSEVADRIAKRDLAVRRLTTGKGEYEGVYVRPDPRGIDVDPHGRVIYDQREVTDADYLHGDAGEVLADRRRWLAADRQP